MEFPEANVTAAQIIAGVLAPTIGYQSTDKLIIRQTESGGNRHGDGIPVEEYYVTGDGTTILENLPLEHPVSPILRRISHPESPGETDVEGEHVSDGVSSTVVLLASLLDEGLELIERGLHPSSVIQGYNTALGYALSGLEEERRLLTDQEYPDEMKLAVAKPTLTGTYPGGDPMQSSDLAVRAAEIIGVPTPESYVTRSVQSDSPADSRLVVGSVLDRNERADDKMPETVSDAKILVLDGHDSGQLMTEEPEAEFTYSGSGLENITQLEEAILNKKHQRVDKIASMGTDVVLTRWGIDTEYQNLLAENNIIGIRGVSPLDLQQVRLSTGAKAVMDPSDILEENLGYAGLVREVEVSRSEQYSTQRKMMVFEKCENPDSVCVFLRGIPSQYSEQLSRELRKATANVAKVMGQSGYAAGFVPGGGATELEISSRIRNRSDIPDRSQLAIDVFSSALEAVPRALVSNSGISVLEVVNELKAAHENGSATAGFIQPVNQTGDVVEHGIVDPYIEKRRQFETAFEVSSLLLSIDDMLETSASETGSNSKEPVYEDAAERQQAHLETE